MEAKVSVYLAGPWLDRLLVAEMAKEFEAAGMVITHPWWNLEGKEDDPAYLTECAQRDVLGVASAAVLVVVNTRQSEGKAVEQGIAIGLAIPIVIIGKRSNIFHHLNVYLVETVEEAIEKVRWITTPGLTGQSNLIVE